jgi:hypothetical protein
MDGVVDNPDMSAQFRKTGRSTVGILGSYSGPRMRWRLRIRRFVESVRVMAISRVRFWDWASTVQSTAVHIGARDMVESDLSIA